MTGTWDESPQFNVVPKSRPYLEALGVIHALLQPAGYLEIGVRHGASLALARCPAVGVDPEPDLRVGLSSTVTVVEASSDEFFRLHGKELDIPVDLALIDGMHLSEFVLRDFIAIEDVAHNNTVVVIDDVFPNHPRQAQRARETRVWMGDVWKISECLRRWRPDLALTPVDTTPGGFLVVSRLNPNDKTFRDGYESIARELLERENEVPVEVLERHGALDVESPPFTALLRDIADRRRQSRGDTQDS